jgi:glutamine phosphoribosylpyrophosphate amidotransferase
VCEILAVAAPTEVAFEALLHWASEVERLGVTGFGWGVAWRADGGVRRYRSAASLAEDRAGAEAAAAVRSDRFLIHLRRPSRLSTVQLADSQPFLDADEEGGVGAFAFCHNGFLDRHAELRSRYERRLRGGADSEVGFEFFRERLADGVPAAGALLEVHERFGGNANLASLSSDGTLLVYGGHAHNPLWRFEAGGLTVAATALHSEDESLFDLLFVDAGERRRIGREVVRIDPRPAQRRRAS